jgi:hypothetical protein
MSIIAPSNGGVVSLLDMLKFNAYAFVSVTTGFTNIDSTIETARKHPHMDTFVKLGNLPERQVPVDCAMLEAIKRDCQYQGLTSVEDQIDLMLARLRSRPVTFEEMSQMRVDLVNRMIHELKRRSFFQLKPDVAAYFETAHPFGEQVFQSFGSTAHDIEEACKCYACERHDATVFHLMRAMESPLRCLAKTVHVKYSPGWAGYLNRIDKKLRNPKTKLRKARKEFLSNTSVLLWAVKDAWRNETMHLEKQYSPEQAAEIFRSVRAFMVHLATGLHE